LIFQQRPFFLLLLTNDFPQKVACKESVTHEIDLWKRFKKGDEDAFAAIYEQYVGILYNYGCHIVADTFLVQDAIQDLFVDLWRMRQNLSDTTSIKFYLFRALRRKLHQLVKAEQFFTKFPTLTPLFTPAQETEFMANEASAEMIQILQNHLKTLPPRQFEAIRLRFFEDFKFEEIASIMDMNEQSVRNLIQRAILKLRKLFGSSVCIFSLLFFL
jgi:RNA polymerase sigma factor (sigma-70 family)